jgi:hypothetical protein
MFDIVSLLVLALATALPPTEPPATTLTTTGRMALKSYTITLVGTAPANGDNDGFADADETIDLAVTLINKTGMDLDGVVATFSTGSSTIECVSKSQVVIGAVPAGATVTAPPFRFKVAGAATVNRINIDQAIQAAFDVAVHATQFNALERPIAFNLPLDLSASGGSGANPWVEDFEIGGSNFGKFTLQNLDGGKNTLALSDGMRCQYNDPDAPNGISSGNDSCFLGFAGDPVGGINSWHVHGITNGFGRAYTGGKSLHWGTHVLNDPTRDATPLRQLDAVKSISPINVPLSGAIPELIFAHQVSMADQRIIGSLAADAVVDRAVVEVNVLNSSGLETTWRKIDPYTNEYDSVPQEYSNCTFDPTDDGNNEDSYFDPADPDRYLGPSSTCMPERVFGRQGDTDYRFAYVPTDIGRAEGPALVGSIDVGTWVQPRFNLQEFAGRKIRIRFVATSIQLSDAQQTWNDYHNQPNVAGDDGWYIDDVRVNAALGTALTLAADTKTITAIPCGACTSIIAALAATPSPAPTPGQPVTLDASGSAADVCLNGALQYQFWIDGNANGIVGDAGDTMLRDFDNAWTFTFAPIGSAQYGVLARCSSATACDALDGSNGATTLVNVDCPSTASGRYAFAQTIKVDKTNPLTTVEPDAAATIHWPVAISVDATRGWLAGLVSPPAIVTLRGAGSFTDSVAECLASNSAPISSIVSNDNPGTGAAFYYLVRGQDSPACSGIGPGYTTNASAEHSGRDTQIDADPVAAACP